MEQLKPKNSYFGKFTYGTNKQCIDIYIYSQVKKGLLTKKSLTEVSNIAVMHRPLRKFTYEKK